MKTSIKNLNAMNHEKRTCESCAYWEHDENTTTVNSSGSCHFWPPVHSREYSSLVTEEIEHPEIAVLLHRLSGLEALQGVVTSESEDIFREYPIKTTYEELKMAQQKVTDCASSIEHLRSQIAEKESELAPTIKEAVVTIKCGEWPVTGKDDWCGQWNSES